MKNHDASRDLQSVLSQGWTARMLLLLVMVALISERSGFSEFSVPPGPVALGFLSALGTLYVLMSFFVRLLQAAWFRWLNAGASILTTVGIMVHHLHSNFGDVAMNGICGTGTHGMFDLVEAAHHVVGVVMSVLAVRWVRLDAAAP
jgi:hypothetical protein